MDFLNKSKDFVNGDSPLSKIVKALIIVIVVMLLVNIGKRIYTGYKKWSEGSPWILKGTKDAKKRMLILQDPARRSNYWKIRE